MFIFDFLKFFLLNLNDFFFFKCPKTPFLLVGLKEDLRSDPQTLEKLQKNSLKRVTFEEGENLCKKLKGCKYCENSSITQKGINETFMYAMEAVLEGNFNNENKKNSGSCIIC
jgi:GTPase SAR1 family protein